MARAPGIGSMSVEKLLKLRDDVGRVLSQKAAELEEQLSKLGGEVRVGSRGRRSAMKGRRHQISRQGRQHVGWARSAACLAAQEAEGGRKVGRLCCAKDIDLTQGVREEDKGAPTQEVMRNWPPVGARPCRGKFDRLIAAGGRSSVGARLTIASERRRHRHTMRQHLRVEGQTSLKSPKFLVASRCIFICC